MDVGEEKVRSLGGEIRWTLCYAQENTPPLDFGATLEAWGRLEQKSE